jgi:hypothetical protein
MTVVLIRPLRLLLEPIVLFTCLFLALDTIIFLWYDWYLARAQKANLPWGLGIQRGTLQAATCLYRSTALYHIPFLARTQKPYSCAINERLVG